MDTKELLTKISDLLEKVGVKAALKNPEVIDTIYNVMTKHGMKVDKAIFSIVMFGIANSEKLDIGALLNLGSGLLGGAQPAGQPSAGAQPSNNAANAANMLGALGALGAMAGAMGGAQQSNAQQSAQPSNNADNAANMLGALGALGAMAGAMGGAQQSNAQPSAQQSAQTQQPNVGDAINAIAGIANALNANKK